MSTSVIFYQLEVPQQQANHVLQVQTYTGKVRLTTTEEIDIDDIRTEVKNVSQHSLSNVDANMLQVFDGKCNHVELDALTIWNPELHGGSRSHPLIVKAPIAPSMAVEGMFKFMFHFRIFTFP